MGISGLLPALAEITKSKHIRKYAGKKVAIDAYCWLHKAAYTCSQDLAKGQGLDKLLQYCLNRLDLLMKANVTPIVVFDGGKLKMKKGVEKERNKNREESRAKAQQYLKEGNEKQAMRYFSMSIDITPKMAHTLILALREINVEYYVAPYEADAQLAYLWKSGMVDVVFTEDSDLLVFGVGTVFFKMDNQGNGEEIKLKNLKKVKKPMCFKSFDHDMLLTACIMSGCDYLESIKGIGFKKAVKLIEDAGADNTFQEAMTTLKEEKKHEIPSKYDKKFRKAFLTFKFQRVFCPRRQKLVHTEDAQENPHGSELQVQKNLNFLGKEIDDETARGVAYGDRDPISLDLFETNEKETIAVNKALKRSVPGQKPKKGKNIFAKNGFNFKHGTANQFIINKKKQKAKNEVMNPETTNGTLKGWKLGSQQDKDEMPNFLKDYPIPEYVTLWKTHPIMFWRRYKEEKAAGTLPEEFKKADFVDGIDAKPDKIAKQTVKDAHEQQFMHDESITEDQRDDAIKAFISRTKYQGDGDAEADTSLGNVLKEFCEQRHTKETKKRESKKKAKFNAILKNKEQERLKKEFIRQIEENSIKANNPMLMLQSQSQNGNGDVELSQQIPQLFRLQQQSQQSRTVARTGNIRTMADVRREEMEQQASQFGFSMPGSTQACSQLDGSDKSQMLSQAEALSQLQKSGKPSPEFEEFFYKYMDPNAYKKKYGAKNKQTIMPPAYMCKQPQRGKKKGGLSHGDFDSSLDDLKDLPPMDQAPKKRGRPRGGSKSKPLAPAQDLINEDGIISPGAVVQSAGVQIGSGQQGHQFSQLGRQANPPPISQPFQHPVVVGQSLETSEPVNDVVKPNRMLQLLAANRARRNRQAERPQMPGMFD